MSSSIYKRLQLMRKKENVRQITKKNYFIDKSTIVFGGDSSEVKAGEMDDVQKSMTSFIPIQLDKGKI